MRGVINDALFALVGVGAMVSGWRLGIGGVTAPDSGLMPFLVGLVLTLLGAGGLLSQAARAGAQDPQGPVLQSPVPWLVTVLAVIGLSWASKHVGLLAASFAFVFLLHKASGSESVGRSAVFAAAVAAVAWFVFVVRFGVKFG